MIWKKYLRVSWDYRVNLVMYSRSGVGWTIFILNCSTGYFFFSISTWNYSPLFLWGVLYIWLYYALWFRFDLETVTKCLPRTTCSHFHGFHKHTILFLFQLLFKIFVFVGCGFVPSGFQMILIILPRGF